jgi:hypothetical protein
LEYSSKEAVKQNKRCSLPSLFTNMLQLRKFAAEKISGFLKKAGIETIDFATVRCD